MDKKSKLIVLGILLFSLTIKAQMSGDTIVVKAFKYGSLTRDTAINFPSGNLTYEKIILKYNMRCKNNLVSTQAAPDQGCGEWDGSCNTYIVDSSKTESDLSFHPSHVISNYTAAVFPYKTQPIYDYYNFVQTNVVLNSIISESQHTLGASATPAPDVLKSNEKSGRTQILYTASELSAAGLIAGNIDGFILNVANAGGAVNFLKVGIQHTTQSSLNSGTVTLNGFTNVFNSNFTFTAGINRIQFFTPFVWNGTSNLLLDLSFTNTFPTNQVVFNGASGTSIMSLYANNNYALDLSSLGHVPVNTALLSGISNQITVSFWAYGNAAQMPRTTTILEGFNSLNQRNLNVHLPWDNNDIYFDCGYAVTGFDRINKTATAAEQGGQWNHWAFTKNVTTGSMKIYLNGALWSSGNGKTKPISILTLILGKDAVLSNGLNYKGKINEFTIWNKELSLADIQVWMNKKIDATHPFYSNLLAYYRMTEGTGAVIADSKNNLTSTGVNVNWGYDRGNNLKRSFTETNIRPNIVFFKGSYALTTNTVVLKDSIVRFGNTVLQYSVTSNATATPVVSDAVVVTSTSNLFHTTPSFIYNGDTGMLTGTLSNVSTGTITITNLSYIRRFPFYNEIMSFVTPYGKGLNLGPNGKTWYFDVSDFAPLLKNKKRIVMTMGGEYFEQMDLDFLFIVGTPPRNVLQFNQLWQGAARLGGVSIANVLNDARFNVLNVPLLSNAQSFKIRSTITGHGSQGEFHQNGGIINHFLNLNGGPNEYSWQITQECSTNPIFPQGGTWVYDRQGWCPGQASLLKEYDVTAHVTPGNTVSIDYNCSNPQVSTGNYDYLVAHQLISYGGANHTTDARILDVLAPSTKVVYSRTNPICASPIILVQNTGSSLITDLDIEYWVNNASVKESFQWSGSLAFMDTISISLPIGFLWTQGITPNNNMFHAEIKTVNGVNDQYVYNNSYRSDFKLPDVLPNNIIVEFKTNNYPSESYYTLLDYFGNGIAGASNLTTANTLYADNYLLDGCYKLVVQDYGNDGLQWWANAGQGSGYVRIKNSVGTILKNFQTDFGGGFEYSFSTTPLNYVDVKNQSFASTIKVFPNPAHDKFQVTGNDLESSTIKLMDVLGRVIEVPVTKDKTAMTFDTSNLKSGVYFISITKGDETVVKKIVIQ